MALLDIVLYPDDPLRQVAEPFDRFTADVEELAHDMIQTMSAYDGVGLAGPQVDVAKQIIVLHEPEGEPMCLVNPEITLQGERVEGEEGCLSLPHIYAIVPRASRVHVRAYSEKGKRLDFDAEDFLARIIQHEYDHLQGIVFPDRLDIITREDKLQEWEMVRQQLLVAARR
jgi:peptide deformylase